MVQHVRTLADVLGGNCVAALTFDDPKAANEVLASLRFERIIQDAVVSDHTGKNFAAYNHDGQATVPLPPEVGAEPGHRFETDGTLQIVAPIYDNNERIGTVVLKAGMTQVTARFHQQLLTALVVLLGSIMLSFVFSSILQKFVSVPIMKLAATAEHISANHDFSIRVERVANDEIGSLYTAFNRMLDQIESSAVELKRSHDDLELRVEDRTSRLSEANETLSHEVVERKKAENELRELQARSIESARRAGMAEIATSVLHNVGNVLNSVNVAAALIRDKLKSSGVADLKNATELLSQHLEDVGEFISSHRQGKQLPRFLIQLSQKMSADEVLIGMEIKTLTENIEHIKGIVSLQQSYAGISGMIEQLSLAELVEDAVKINSQSISRHKIELVREFEDLPPLQTEKQKVLQILVNLISNAKYAIAAVEQSSRRITLRVSRAATDRVCVEVIDNGIGIPPENVTRIFSHGFTTRRDGHGFGLHSAANLARELGGALTARSAGLGQGAAFTLELPFKTGRASTTGNN